MNELLDENVFEHMRKVSEYERATHHYFRNSAIWDAIVRHIVYDEQVLLVQKPTIDSETKIGNVRLRDVGCYAKNYGEHIPGKGYEVKESSHFWMKLEVEWYSEEAGGCITKDYELTHVPVELVSNFNKEKFDEWTMAVGMQRIVFGVTHKLQDMIMALPECLERNRIISDLYKIRNGVSLIPRRLACCPRGVIGSTRRL